MAYTTLVSGTNITSSWANASVRDQVVSPFVTSAARTAAITSPVAGMVSSLTTYDLTEGIEFYNSAGQWRKPWNMPWGIITTTAGGTSNLGYVNVTSAQGSIGATGVSLTNMTMTFNTAANRMYRLSVHTNFYSTQAGDTAGIVALIDGSNVGYAFSADLTATSASLRSLDLVKPFTRTTGGSMSVIMQAYRQSGPGGTLTMQASAVNPATMMIEDIGPSGAPS